MNLCLFKGRMGQDPEIKQTATTMLIRFSIAVDASYKSKDGDWIKATEWVNCVAFGKLAEIIQQRTQKGCFVLVTTKVKTNEYEKDGKKAYSTSFVVQSIDILSGGVSKDDGLPDFKSDDDLPF